MNGKKHWLLALALLAIAPFLVSDTYAKKGGNKPPPDEPPADPAIAYAMNGNNGLWVMNADGSNQTRIHTPTDYLLKVSWSGDGESIAFIQGDEIWRIDVSVVGGVPTGSNATLLLADEFLWPNACNWSPTSGAIAYITDVEPCELRAVFADGGDPVTLYAATGPQDLKGAAWSPDGTEIATLERVGDDLKWNTLRIITVSTGVVRKTLSLPQSTGHVGFWGHMSWARTGDEIAYVEVTEKARGKKTVRTETVRVIDIDTGIATSVVEGRDPCWSPDDSQMVLAGVKVHDLASGTTDGLTWDYGRDPDWRRRE